MALALATESSQYGRQADKEILHWGYIGIMEKKMETTIMGYIGIMEKKMETTMMGYMGITGSAWR